MFVQSGIQRRVRPGAIFISEDRELAILHLPAPFTGRATFSAGRVEGDLSWRAMTGMVTPLSSPEVTLTPLSESNCFVSPIGGAP